MRNQNAGNFAQCVVTVALTGLFLSIGWLTLWWGGIAVQARAGQLAVVGSGWVVALAVGGFFLAAVAALLLARAFALGRLGVALLLATLFLPPILFVSR
jgi:hypothetical protein